ncbi:hypothetical protein Cabys_3538 [Caldithrix abyssi DSM 13497]|uniref:Uncharacterized protein n=1 Tax=Caldithrix abyssi DSM 13497 TaxID=880073 RepID=A0A1J1CD30_CALAY|nr:hypothetical protein Cabys_3538 [Caldithrix abyssi DSM 13497]
MARKDFFNFKKSPLKDLFRDGGSENFCAAGVVEWLISRRPVIPIHA